LREKKGENRKEGEKYEVVESGVSKELSHSFMPIKEEKKGLFFLINCFQKIILQDGQRANII